MRYLLDASALLNIVRRLGEKIAENPERKLHPYANDL